MNLIALVLAAGDKEETMSTYMSFYMKEIQMEGLVRKIGGFSISSGSLIDSILPPNYHSFSKSSTEKKTGWRLSFFIDLNIRI